jgi:hypothetical protein
MEEPAGLLDHIKNQLLCWLETDRGKDRVLLTDTFRPSMLACRDLESVRLLLSQQVYATEPTMRLTTRNIDWLITEAHKSYRGGFPNQRTRMDLELEWHGPYSVVEGRSVPCLFSSMDEATGCPGVYLWTVSYGDEELIFYVGKTDASFTKRLRTEFRSCRKRAWDWIADPEVRKARIGRPDCLDWIPDPEQFQRGVKAWVYKPLVGGRPDLEKWVANEAHFADCWNRFLQCLRIFIAPVAEGGGQVKDVETALMWAVWDHEDATRIEPGSEEYFLSNGRPIPKRLPYRFTVRSNSPVRFRGLGPVISG